MHKRNIDQADAFKSTSSSLQHYTTIYCACDHISKFTLELALFKRMFSSFFVTVF